MGQTSGTLPQLLSHPSTRRGPASFERTNVSEMRKPGRTWIGPDGNKLSRGPLETALRRALEDDRAAERVLAGLSPAERAVVAAYRRYGGTVDGEVIRLDLMARGLLEILEKHITEHYTQRRWRRNLVTELADRWVLLREGSTGDSFYYGGYGEPDRPFARYSLHAGVAGLVEPAGPPPWSVAPAEGTPQATTRRTSADVALDLSRVFAFVAARGAVKTRLDGTLSVTTLRAMEKAVPLDDDPEFGPPEPHGLYFELLRYAGAVRVEGNTAVADHAAAVRMFGQADPWQAYAWARAWLHTRRWNDGVGIPEARDADEEGRGVSTARQVAAWALGCLARAGDRWYDLGMFLSALTTLQGETSLYLPYSNLAWDPDPSSGREKARPGVAAYPRAGPYRREGRWYANMLMVTLVELGLAERGRLGRVANAPHAFRLTGLGRAVFGAPEVPMPAESAERRFLVVQPNFDLLAYVDEADAASAGLLGRVAEGDAAHSGPVRTFRLTRESVYQAEESGLGHDQIVAFLEQHARGTLPANVLRSLSDWTGRRESLVLRSGITLLCFPSEADRDAYLKRRAGTACGSRFVIATEPQRERIKLASALVSGVSGQGRRTLGLDEHGGIHAGEPLDIVQRARLGRLATPSGPGWRLTRDSIGRAVASGLKPALVHQWLSSHLSKPMPPLIAHAIDAWMGKAPPLAMGDAILLSIPEGDLFKAIAASPRLRPFLLGKVGPGWLAVRRETRKDLAHALKELGFTIGRHLTWAEGADDGDGN